MNNEKQTGRVLAVGMGPGGQPGMTAEAWAALERADVLCGYRGYIELVRPLFPDKPVLSSGMTQEEDRCHAALRSAASGNIVAMICSGDAGVYGMAGLLLELLPGYAGVELEVLPGVTAALSGAALLGAPLMHDFAVVSLSDLLTPWPAIEKRLRLAAQADFVLCLYNPASRTRKHHLRRAVDILLAAGLPPERACGWARQIGREGQESGVLTLQELRGHPADMFTTVFVGKSDTRMLGDKLLTPRGYQNKT